MYLFTIPSSCLVLLLFVTIFQCKASIGRRRRKPIYPEGLSNPLPEETMGFLRLAASTSFTLLKDGKRQRESVLIGWVDFSLVFGLFWLVVNSSVEFYKGISFLKFQLIKNWIKIQKHDQMISEGPHIELCWLKSLLNRTRKLEW